MKEKNKIIKNEKEKRKKKKKKQKIPHHRLKLKEYPLW